MQKKFFDKQHVSDEYRNFLAENPSLKYFQIIIVRGSYQRRECQEKEIKLPFIVCAEGNFFSFYTFAKLILLDFIVT